MSARAFLSQVEAIGGSEVTTKQWARAVLVKGDERSPLQASVRFGGVKNTRSREVELVWHCEEFWFNLFTTVLLQERLFGDLGMLPQENWKGCAHNV